MVKKPVERRFDFLMAIVTALISAASSILLYLIYGLTRNSVLPDGRMPLMMGILFGLFLLICCLAVFIVSSFRRTFRTDLVTGYPSRRRIIPYILVGALVCFGLMMGMEALYEHQFASHKEQTTYTEYVFLIDDSGTMESNDPDMLRYSAIREIMEQQSPDTKFCVYSFSNDTRLLIPMQTAADGFPPRLQPDYGGTYMKEALIKVITDFENGVWTSGGNTALVLITDGYPSDISLPVEIRGLLNRYVDAGIPINIVGVIGADNSLMQKICDHTGGTFTDISDVTSMGSAMEQVMTGNRVNRDLLSLRPRSNPNWIYALIRVAAITIAGILLALTACFAYGRQNSVRFILLVNGLKALLAGILIESAFLLPFGSTLLVLTGWILLGILLTVYDFSDHESNHFIHDNPLHSGKRFHIGKNAGGKNSIKPSSITGENTKSGYENHFFSNFDD